MCGNCKIFEVTEFERACLWLLSFLVGLELEHIRVFLSCAIPVLRKGNCSRIFALP
jgi:hypothetical protein